MTYAGSMLAAHPQAASADRQGLEDCINACMDCAQACTACADACLAEGNLNILVPCIRLNLDCADICTATGRMLSRQTQVSWELVVPQLEAGATACRLCGEECRKHSDHHEHCRICAAVCEDCERVCRGVLALASSFVAI